MNELTKDGLSFRIVRELARGISAVVCGVAIAMILQYAGYSEFNQGAGCMLTICMVYDLLKRKSSS